MTQRERMQKTIAHELPDRTPAVLACRPEMDRALLEWYGVKSMGEVHRILGTDGWGGVGVGLDWGDYWQRCNGTREGDWPGAGRPYIWHDHDVYEDEWGVVRRVGSDEKYVQWVDGPLSTADSVEAADLPGPDRLVIPPNLAEIVQEQKDRGMWVSAGVTQPFKQAWELCGMRRLFSAYLLEREFLEQLYDRLYALGTAILTTCTAAGVDMVSVGGDIAMQDRVMVGPRLWREVDKPRLAAMIAACKRINPEVHVFIHSDGKLDDIMPDLIEIGFDIIDPIQPECMDPFEIKRLYGDRIVLHGCGSLQRVLPYGTVEDVRRHVVDLIEGCGYNGGLVLRVSNAIGFDVPVANVVTFFETARDYDLSALRS